MLQEPPPLLPLLSINLSHSVSHCLSVCVADSQPDRRLLHCPMSYTTTSLSVNCSVITLHCPVSVDRCPSVKQSINQSVSYSIITIHCPVSFNRCPAVNQSVSIQLFDDIWCLLSVISGITPVDRHWFCPVFLLISCLCALRSRLRVFTAAVFISVKALSALYHSPWPWDVVGLVWHQSFWRLLTSSVTWWMDKWTTANSTVPCDRQHCAVWSSAQKDAVSCHCRL